MQIIAAGCIRIESTHVRIETTRPQYGGARLWFCCPRCGRRCRILYRRDGYACRVCLDLTYPSRTLHRTHHLSWHRACRLATVAVQKAGRACNPSAQRVAEERLDRAVCAVRAAREEARRRSEPLCAAAQAWLDQAEKTGELPSIEACMREAQRKTREAH